MIPQTAPGPAPDAAGTGEVQFEVLPLKGIVDRVLAELPPASRVTVTASPAQGVAATVGTACALAEHGFTAIPHLAARMLRDRAEVGDILGRLTEAGVGEAFVVAGDASPPAGEFRGALDLLEAVTEVASGTGSPLVLGTGAHPEGHPFVDEAEALRLLQEKALHASYLVTQMCFAAGPLLEWTRRLRETGATIPVRPGIAAPVGTARLLRIGARTGVGRSLRLLTGEDAGVRRLLGPRAWDPRALMVDLRDAQAAAPELALLAPHLFTFNDLRAAQECVGTT